MKKICVLIIALLSLSMVAKAQVNLHAGVVNTQQVITVYSTTASTSTLSDMGYYAGLGYQLNLDHNFGFNFGADANLYSTAQRLDVAVPIMFNYSVRLGNKAKLSLMSGAMLNMEVMNNAEASARTEIPTDGFNWGLLAGGRLGMGRLGIHGIYYYGMTDFAPSDMIQCFARKVMVGLDLNL